MGTLKKVCYSFIHLLFLPLITSTAISTGDCVNSTWCGNIEIRFPFRLKDGRQPKNCGYPGFDLSCTNNNKTTLDLPFSGKFSVYDIYYSSQTILIYDQVCLVRRLLNFNLSDSPFKIDAKSNFTLLNCSRDVQESYFGNTISCLSRSSSTYRVIYFPPGASALVTPAGNCKLLGTVSFAWITNSIGKISSLYLTWDNPDCSICESERRKCGFQNYSTSLDIGCFGIPRALPRPLPRPEEAFRENTTIRHRIKNIAIGVSIGFFVFLVAILTFIKTRKQTDTKEKESQLKIENFLQNYKSLKPMRYSYTDIKKITNKFNCKLGQGGYGSVFQGKLTNGTPVAVKILNESGGNGEEFINEIGIIGRIHHVNVVRLLGFCADGFKRALIYEFMPNQSLDKFIFSGKDSKPYLCWEKLQDIAIGIARGIEYLHQGCEQRILHFDIKPQNILLDHNLNPKISDFGLAKLCAKGDSIVSMAAARGTMGYIAPEVFSRNFGNVSYKSDIYSFGMLLLEMVGGRKNIEVKIENPSQVFFPEWIYYRLDKGEDLGIQADTEEDATLAKKLTMVAIWCIEWQPADRPSMKSVVQMLEGNIENLIMPPNPFASTAAATSSTTNIPDITTPTELTVIKKESK